MLLIGCGILKKEIKLIIEKNKWPLDTLFLDSALHIDFKKLSGKLTSALEKHHGKNIIVFYGCCHPLMEQILEKEHTFRTRGQNCVDILLGYEFFSEELAKGAFFLLEDWALRWDHVVTKTFGNNEKILKDIFQGDRKYLLCVRTPCSGSFEVMAEQAGKKVGLPIKWTDSGLEHLESVLTEAVAKKMKELECKTQE
ncbi:DUF1638 [Desulfonema limicola]|uniref:DUF1638 n=2 Tax=Desulfonema limicola TaxID=45656 RepID=A0A975GGX5_9BACT|nr:DUF1638 [Desulfonema limicola]